MREDERKAGGQQNRLIDKHRERLHASRALHVIVKSRGAVSETHTHSTGGGGGFGRP
jgi:hypothetical protein